VIVGAGSAGLAAAEGLRRGGFIGRVTLIGDEPHIPYDRPPLSKQFLAGEWDLGQLRLRQPETYAASDVDLRTGVTATALDTGNREVVLTDGSRESYDEVVIATGVRARALPGTEHLPGVHVLRTLDDAIGLQAAMKGRPRLVIVGGGFIGAEAAYVARKLGCEVTMVTDRLVPLADAVGDDVGGMLTQLHQEHGVRIEADVLVEGVVTDGSRATGVRLADGRTLPAEAVIVGIGARPNVEWLSGSGVPVGNGVECDERLYAGNGVWAAGDVASWTDPDSGERLRIEHRTNAAEQGLAVARNILAGPDAATPFRTVPYVWSDQYDLKVQIHGRTRGADRVHIVEGSLTQRKFTALYGREGRVTAALGVNMMRPLRALRPFVAERADWDTTLAGLTTRAA
jgi:3-phenylpropionate/trans-cinnamate dioxygenase ferredoxin reductase subunit